MQTIEDLAFFSVQYVQYSLYSIFATKYIPFTILFIGILRVYFFKWLFSVPLYKYTRIYLAISLLMYFSI